MMKSPRYAGFTGEFYETLKELPLLLKLFTKIEEEGTLLNLISGAFITLILKPEKKTTGKETHGPITL